ncbi:MAG TPA: dienelactone hydrolase family protein [Phycisphaerae bacterium]|nr:dienelactone hydrolase family protein [Phycisphaerae bacterium]
MNAQFRIRFFRGLMTAAFLFSVGHAFAQDPEQKRIERQNRREGQGSPASQPAGYQITTETIEIPRGDVKVKAYFARPVTQTPVPGLILVHEWYGLNDWVKQQADRFARNGFAAIAVDLYRGEVASDSDHAHELMRGLPEDRAIADMKAAFAHLAMQEAVRGEKIGAIGWCMGGSYSLQLAIEEPKLDAAVICYGRPVNDPERLKLIKCPLLGIWGETDRGIEVEPFRKALKEAKIDAEHHVYPGAGHAFLNENNKRGFDAKQAGRAWKEIDAFLEKTLRRQPVGQQAEQEEQK